MWHSKNYLHQPRFCLVNFSVRGSNSMQVIDVCNFYVFSSATIPQWKVFCTVNLILSSSSRRRVVSTRIFSHVCLFICWISSIFDFCWLFLFHLFTFPWISFSTAAKSAEKLTPEMVNFPYCTACIQNLIMSGEIYRKESNVLLGVVTDSQKLELVSD